MSVQGSLCADLGQPAQERLSFWALKRIMSMQRVFRTLVHEICLLWCVPSTILESCILSLFWQICFLKNLPSHCLLKVILEQHERYSWRLVWATHWRWQNGKQRLSLSELNRIQTKGHDSPRTSANHRALQRHALPTALPQESPRCWTHSTLTPFILQKASKVTELSKCVTTGSYSNLLWI